LALLHRQIERIVRNNAQAHDYEKIKALLEQELAFAPVPNSALVTSILDKITVHNTGDRNKLKLDIHLKIGEIFPIESGENALSFCSKRSRTGGTK
jgi:hypothetical protein